MATSEAMDGVQPTAKTPAVDMENLKRKKFKAEDLPITTAQRTVIDTLLHSFKKKGGFDTTRKQIWAEFNNSGHKITFTDQLVALAESEIEREPAHLARERGKAATLIQGAVDRGDVYKNVEQSIDELTAKYLDNILGSVRAIRREDVGDEQAMQEEKTGGKTDEDYDSYVKAKREEREKAWREEMRKQKEIDDEERRIKTEEARKRREAERLKEDEDRARRKEIDDQRRAEREALDDQRDRERQERYERRRREDRDRYRDWDRDRSRTRDRDRDRYRDRSPAYRSDRGYSPRSRDIKQEISSPSKDPTPAAAAPVDEKSLEEAALQMLLKEGEELAAKARQKPEFDFEEAEAIENGLKPSASASGPTRSTNDPKLSSAPTRATSHSRDSRRHDSTAGRSDRPRHHIVERSRSRSRSRRRRGSRYDPDRRGYRDFRDDRSYRPTRRSRSRSPARRDRDRERSPDRERDRDRRSDRDVDRRRERSLDRDRNRDDYRPRRRYSRSPSRRRSRSRSRRRGRDQRSRSAAPRRRSPSRSAARRRSPSRRRSRSRRADPVSLDIDRYVPSTSNRSKSPRRRVRSPERERDRDRDREQRPRAGEIDRYMPGSGPEKNAAKKDTEDTSEQVRDSEERRTRPRSRSRRRSPSRRRSRSRRRSLSRRRSRSRRSRSR